jgi:hypothetical protein
MISCRLLTLGPGQRTLWFRPYVHPVEPNCFTAKMAKTAERAPHATYSAGQPGIKQHA